MSKAKAELKAIFSADSRESLQGGRILSVAEIGGQTFGHMENADLYALLVVLPVAGPFGRLLIVEAEHWDSNTSLAQMIADYEKGDV